MKKYDVYLFDYDYTLANSEIAIVHCFKYVFTKHNYTNISEESIKRTIGMPLLEAFSLLTGVKDKQMIDQFYDDFSECADEHMTEETFFYPGAVEMLKRVRERGAKTGIISTKRKSRIEDFLNHNQYNELFDLILGLGDVSKPKPDPEGINYAINSLGVSKEKVLYVGDSVIDAEAGKNAGVDFAGITNGMTSAEELSAYPHVTIMKSFDEID